MKGRRSGIMLTALGVVLALVVGLLVFITVQSNTSRQIAMADVVVATEDIPERVVIKPVAVAVKSLPVEAIPVGALAKTDDVIGKMAPAKIYAGETILSSKLVDSKGQTGLSFTMEKGKVLVTFPASNIVGLGLVKPGDTVDVLVTYRPSKNKTTQQTTPTVDLMPPNMTQLTMQNLKVVSIGGQTTVSQQGPQQSLQQQQQTQPSFITFATEPQDALALKAIKDSEDLVIDLALRSAGDDTIFKTEPVTIKGILERYGVNTSLLPR